MTKPTGATLSWLSEAILAGAVPGRAEHEKRYLRSDLEHIGAPVPHLRRVAKDLAKRDPEFVADPWPLVHAAWATDVYEMRACMTFALEHCDVAGHAGDLEALLRDSHTWALVDQLAIKVLPGAGLPRATLVAWSLDDDKWIRRAALLHDLLALRAGADPEPWAVLAAPNLEHPDFFIRKAIGWVLRETGKRRPDWVRSYVAAHQEAMAPLTIREATRNLPPA